MNRKFLINVQFDGRHFDGFQKNENCKSIQTEIELALKKLFEKEIFIQGSSRTDKGVSAKEFYFTFEAETKLPADRVAFKLNRFLPKSIQCQQSKEVENNFNLRNSIASKTYKYSVYTGNHIQPLKNAFSTFVEGDLNVEKMIECSKVFLGQHNFKSFCNQNSDTTTFEREMLDITIKQNNDCIDMYFTANNFLFNMVRILVGTLIECGKSKLQKQDIENLLQIKDRSKNPAKTMPAKGLILENVKFK